MQSYFFEDFKPEQSFDSSGRTITETDLTFFSMLSGDWNPIHANVEYAKSTRSGRIGRRFRPLMVASCCTM